MKYMVKIITGILIVTLMGIAFLLVSNFIKLNAILGMEHALTPDYVPQHHFKVIIDGHIPDYEADFLAGAIRGANDYEVVFEFWSPVGKNITEIILEQFESGVYAQVDGIVVHTYNHPEFERVMAMAQANGIHLVTLNEEVVTQEKVSHMAYNHYRIGQRLGDIFNQLKPEQGTIIVLQNGEGIEQEKARGLFDYFEGQYDVTVEVIESVGENLLNAEGLTRQLLNKYPDVVGIVCSDSRVTLGVVQGLKEANRVADIMLIGFGMTPDIEDFLEKEVIQATVVADYENLGYKSIVHLSNALNGDFVSQYPSIEVTIIEKETLIENHRGVRHE